MTQYNREKGNAERDQKVEQIHANRSFRQDFGTIV
jgi:hypothetical protein